MDDESKGEALKKKEAHVIMQGGYCVGLSKRMQDKLKSRGHDLEKIKKTGIDKDEIRICLWALTMEDNGMVQKNDD